MLDDGVHYEVAKKKKKKQSITKNCLLHCRQDCGSDDIVKFSERSLEVSNISHLFW